MPFVKKLLSIASISVLSATALVARDKVHIAGSSTVLPYASIVAEAFGENFDFPTPIVEGGGSGAGRKRMCEGVGLNTIDIANSSSLMKQEQWDACQASVGKITEVRIGYDGITFSARLENEGFSDLTPAQIYLAISDKSTASTWADVDPALPDVAIKAFIPGTKHGTREVFEKKVMLAGCKEVGAYQKLIDEGLEKKLAEKECFKVRTDGSSVDIDGDYTETLASLDANPEGIGVFGLSFLGRHVIKTVGEKITALTPSLGFSANLATSITVVAASYIGFPISTTHTLVGGVIGVGIARSAKDLNTDSIKKIITSWLVTIPIGAAFTVLFFVILRLIFGV